MLKKQLSLLLVIILLGLPAIHKISGEIPPNWFLTKFENSLMGEIPGLMLFSYLIIMALEVIGPLLLILGGIKMWQKKDYQPWVSNGFTVYYVLFIILTFGSFLVEDYDNGFKDVLFFVGVLVIDQVYFGTRKKSPSIENNN